MKKLVAALLAATLAVSMSSCSALVKKSSGSGNSSNLTVWTMYSVDQDTTKPYGRLQKWASDFNAKNKNIKVTVEGGKTANVILTAISAGSTPDIFQNQWQLAPSYSKAGSIVDLTKFVNSDTKWNKSDFLDSVWGLCTYNNKIYSIPFTASTTYILYNPDILAQAGYSTFPKTMDDLEKCAIATTVMKDGSIVRAGLNPIFPWEDDVLWPVAFGAKWQDSSGNITFDTDAMRKAYTFEKDLIDNMGGYAKVSAWVSNFNSTRSTTNDPLLTGKCAMYFASDSNLAPVEAAAQQINATYKIATLPNQMLTAGVWEMNAKTPSTSTAWTVLSSLTSADNMKYMANGDSNKGMFTPRKSSLKALEGYNVSDSVKQAANLLMTSNLEHFPMNGYVNDYLSSIGTHMAAYLSGKETLDSAMANVQKEATAAKNKQ